MRLRRVSSTSSSLPCRDLRRRRRASRRHDSARAFRSVRARCELPRAHRLCGRRADDAKSEDALHLAPGEIVGHSLRRKRRAGALTAVGNPIVMGSTRGTCRLGRTTRCNFPLRAVFANPGATRWVSTAKDGNLEQARSRICCFARPVIRLSGRALDAISTIKTRRRGFSTRSAARVSDARARRSTTKKNEGRTLGRRCRSWRASLARRVFSVPLHCDEHERALLALGRRVGSLGAADDGSRTDDVHDPSRNDTALRADGSSGRSRSFVR